MTGPSTHQDSPIERFEFSQGADEAAEVSSSGPWIRFSDHRSLVEGLVEALESILPRRPFPRPGEPMFEHQDSPKVPEAAVELLARFKWEAAKGATWDAAEPVWKEPWLNVARKQAYELAPLFSPAGSIPVSALLSDEVKARMLDVLGERGWHATATPDEAAEPDLAAVVAKAHRDLGDALTAAIEQVGGSK